MAASLLSGVTFGSTDTGKGIEAHFALLGYWVTLAVVPTESGGLSIDVSGRLAEGNRQR